MIELTVEQLTKQNFAPFGQVIETEGSKHFMINNGSTVRFDKLAVAETTHSQDQILINIFRASRLEYPLAIKMLERHPLGTQAFIPMNNQRFLIVVAPAAAQPDPNDIRAFVTNGHQGVNYAKGVWHHPLLTLEDNTDYLVVDRSGEGNNCDEYFFSEQEAPILGNALEPPIPEIST